MNDLYCILKVEFIGLDRWHWEERILSQLSLGFFGMTRHMTIFEIIKNKHGESADFKWKISNLFLPMIN